MVLVVRERKLFLFVSIFWISRAVRDLSVREAGRNAHVQDDLFELSVLTRCLLEESCVFRFVGVIRFNILRIAAYKTGMILPQFEHLIVFLATKISFRHTDRV